MPFDCNQFEPLSKELKKELWDHQEQLGFHLQEYLGDRNLDIGCGTGMASVYHASKFQVSPFLCDVADLRCYEAASLPFGLLRGNSIAHPNNAFDSSYLQYVLHHIPTDRERKRLLSEALRVANRAIVIEEIVKRGIDVEEARARDQVENARIHSGVIMPIYSYYDKRSFSESIRSVGADLKFSVRIEIEGQEDWPFETWLFVAE